MDVSGEDVAREAGVSPATVSLVLNGRTNVSLSPATRERVTAVAQRLGYRPNQVARNLLRGRTQTIGVILPTLASSFVAQIAEGIQAAAGDHQHQVLLAHTRHDREFEARQLELLLQHRVDGILLVAGEATLPQLPEHLDTLARRPVPIVVVDDRTHRDRVDCVVSDDRTGAAAAVTHLISAGHRRIGFLGAGEGSSSARDRLAGYRTALRQAGIAFDPTLVAGRSYLDDESAKAAATLLDRRNRPTALFAANDRRLAEALPVLDRLGLRVPEDLALVGYANYDFSAYLGLTSVEQGPGQLGRVALQRLLQRIEDSSLKPLQILEPVHLVIRRSCGTGRRSP